jgi:hypothetical protein
VASLSKEWGEAFLVSSGGIQRSIIYWHGFVVAGKKVAGRLRSFI